MRLNWIVIIVMILVAGTIYFFTTPIHVSGDIKNYKYDDFDIEIENRKCINCSWLDPTNKKRTVIVYEGTQKKFNPESPTIVDRTRIIIGKTKVSSVFKKEGINRIIFFPNELDKLETYNFDTGDDLNASGFIDQHFWVDDKLERVMENLELVLLDKVFE